MPVPDHFSLPADMVAAPRWLLWKAVPLEDGRVSKVPRCAADPERNASSTDAATWASFDEAVAALPFSGCDGLGFVLGDGFCGVDLDKCMSGSPNSGLLASAGDVLMALPDTYTEVSPSGAGLHALLRGELPGAGRKRAGVELYGAGRYFTVTGKRFLDSPLKLADATTELASLWRSLGGSNGSSTHASSHASSWPEIELRSDAEPPAEKLARLLAGPHLKARDTWEQRRPDLADQSASSYDLALASLAAHAGWTAQEIADLLIARRRKAGDELHLHNVQKYQRTIALAMDGAADSPNGESPPADAPKIRFTPSDELLASEPEEPDWMWEGALVRGAVTLFAGRPKAGKSTLLYSLARATARRENVFLGRELEGGPVVYASEEGHATLAATFPRHPDIHLVTRDDVWPKPDWRDLLAAAAAKVRETRAALCTVDTFSFWNGLAQEQEKDAGAVQPLLDALTEITVAGCPVALVHHHRKAAGEDGTAVRGSSAIVGAVDAFLEIEPIRDAPKNQRQIVVTSRWPMPPVLMVEWSLTGYRVVGEAGSREEAAERSWPERILAALPREGDGWTLDQLEDLLNADRRKWSKSLNQLIDNKRVVRSGGGKKNDPYRHIVATEIPSPDSVPQGGTERDGMMIPDSVLRSNTGRNQNHSKWQESRPIDGRDGIGAVDGLGRCRRCKSPWCSGECRAPESGCCPGCGRDSCAGCQGWEA